MNFTSKVPIPEGSKRCQTWFDWHYLFGYATLVLVSVRLIFNLPVVLRWLRREPPQRPATERQRGGTLMLGKAAVILAALGLAFFLGTRQGASEISLHRSVTATVTSNPVDAVIRFHEYSSESRGSVFWNGFYGAAMIIFFALSGLMNLKKIDVRPENSRNVQSRNVLIDLGQINGCP